MNGKNDSPLAQNARAILNAALACEHGLEVEVTAVGDVPTPTLRAKQVLYRFKKENTMYDRLRIFQSPTNENLLWITNQDVGD
jgi:hypothetical protein